MLDPGSSMLDREREEDRLQMSEDRKERINNYGY